MKRQIRKGVFETNSSSTHSLTIEYYEQEFTTPSGDAVIAFGEYGYDG